MEASKISNKGKHTFVLAILMSVAIGSSYSSMAIADDEGCQEGDNCVTIIGGDLPKEIGIGGGLGGGGIGDDGGGVGVGAGGSWDDPRSEEEIKQCKASVDKIVTSCIALYTGSTALLTSGCSALAIRYGGSGDWIKWFTAQCVGYGGLATYKAIEWCNEQGDAKKARDC